MTLRLAVMWLTTSWPDVWYRHIPTAIYSLYNVAPDDGLRKSETYTAPYENKDWRLITRICASSCSINIHFLSCINAILRYYSSLG